MDREVYSLSNWDSTKNLGTIVFFGKKAIYKGKVFQLNGDSYISPNEKGEFYSHGRRGFQGDGLLVFRIHENKTQRIVIQEKTQFSTYKLNEETSG